jgi:long-subunit acyl-CoA synthetase (AMP-forming)
VAGDICIVADRIKESMKTIIATLALLIVSTAAYANANVDQQSYCSNYASMLKSIAAWRDQGMSPEKTLDLMRGVKGISPQEKKDAINAVYFDKSLANSRGTEFGNQVRLNCLAEKSK